MEVLVAMRLASDPLEIMLMLVMLIMYVRMHVPHASVDVRMSMIFGQVQSDACAHQESRDPEDHPGHLPEQQ